MFEQYVDFTWTSSLVRKPSTPFIHQAPVVQKVDNVIPWINLYPCYWTAQFVSQILIRRIGIFPVDSAIHLSNNPGQGGLFLESPDN